MSRLTLRLPETLHQQLTQVAEQEGVSLNQYIVYALTRQTVNSPPHGTLASFNSEIDQQRLSFESLKAKLGKASPADIEAMLTNREIASGKPELDTEMIDRLRTKIKSSTDFG